MVGREVVRTGLIDHVRDRLRCGVRGGPLELVGREEHTGRLADPSTVPLWTGGVTSPWYPVIRTFAVIVPVASVRAEGVMEPSETDSVTVPEKSLATEPSWVRAVTVIEKSRSSAAVSGAITSKRVRGEGGGSSSLGPLGPSPSPQAAQGSCQEHEERRHGARSASEECRFVVRHHAVPPCQRSQMRRPGATPLALDYVRVAGRGLHRARLAPRRPGPT